MDLRPAALVPVTAYDPYSRGAEAYRLLAEEIAAKHPTAAPV